MIQKQLEELKEHVSLMARRAEAILDMALETLEKQEETLFQKTVSMDRELNAMEIQMDEKCMRLLALQEPFALDFRYIFSSIKTTRDLERIGDESKTIARWSLRLPGGQVSAGGATRLLPGRDGWCALTLSRPDDIDAVPALVERDGARRRLCDRFFPGICFLPVFKDIK